MKVIELKHVEKLIEIMERRDSFNDWSQSYDKYDDKLRNSIEWIKKNAIDIKEIDNAKNGCKFYENCSCIDSLDFEERVSCHGDCLVHTAVEHDKLIDQEQEQ